MCEVLVPLEGLAQPDNWADNQSHGENTALTVSLSSGPKVKKTFTSTIGLGQIVLTTKDSHIVSTVVVLSVKVITVNIQLETLRPLSPRASSPLVQAA